MRFKITTISCAFLLTMYTTSLFSQVIIPQNNDDENYESLNDSIDLANNFYDYEDSLSYLFSEDTISVDYSEIANDTLVDSLYGNWDNEHTHYPKIDFTNKTDTTLLFLVDNNKFCFFDPINGVVTSHFGLRRHRYHYGTDVNLNTGDSVRAAFDGRVRIRKYSRSYGYVVVVRHFNGLETLYAHLSKIIVDTNQNVKSGEVLGLGGNTGRSHGSHLHFEIRYLGAPLNPEQVINFETGRLISDTLKITKSSFYYLSDIKKLKEAKYHKIRSGDTLSHIAAKYHTTVSRICSLNGIRKTSLLRAGKRIRVR